MPGSHDLNVDDKQANKHRLIKTSEIKITKKRERKKDLTYLALAQDIDPIQI